MQTGFQLFGPEHLAVIAIVPALAAFLAITRRHFPRAAKPIRYALAFLLLVCTVSYYGNWFVHGERMFPDHVPLELCDIALWLVIGTMLTLNRAIFDVAYYWALIGTALAVVTPNLTNPSLFLEVQFFADHGLIVVAVLYLLWSGELRPRRGSVVRSLMVLNVLAALVGAFDFIYKTNYMFLRRKPDGETLMNLLGPWPWYIAVCEGLGLLLFPLLYLPFWRRPAGVPAIQAECEAEVPGAQ